MPFSKATKARMFVRCARICCLCFKPCGTNIEAAHIIDEGEGGSNDDDNGIPVCLDCHQEIGAYDPKHPKGNQFTPEELKARRDQLYSLVESGVLQAQIIAGRLHGMPVKEIPNKDIPRSISRSSYRPTSEAKSILQAAKTSSTPAETLPLKLQLLSEHDQAYVLDKLVESFEEGSAGDSLMAILSAEEQGEKDMLILEQVLRRVTLSTEPQIKAEFLSSAPIALFKRTDEGLRIAFFTDIIATMEQNQFAHVNKITPAVPRAQDAIPKDLEERYTRALLSQANSHAWDGAPAAQRALKSLPDNLALAGLRSIDKESLLWRSDEYLVEFLNTYRSLWPVAKKAMFDDFTSLSRRKFCEKYWDDDF